MPTITKITIEQHIHYTIHSLYGKTGNATLLITELGPPPYDFTQEKAVIKEGLIAGQRIAGITDFFPNGDPPAPQQMRRGVGTAVLEKIIEDARENKCILLFASTIEEVMKRFLEKNEFAEYDQSHKMTHYYKRIISR